MIERDGFTRIISDTTRPPRANEVDGVDYNFITDEAFKDNCKNGIYFQRRDYKTSNGIWYYASCRVDPEMKWVTIVDIPGVYSYLDEYGDDNIQLFYIFADTDTRRQRYLQRDNANTEEMLRRFKADDEDFSNEKLLELCKKYRYAITAVDNNSIIPIPVDLQALIEKYTDYDKSSNT